MNKLDYYNGKNEVPEGTFRISASSISKFFDHTRQWWGENLLGEEGFNSSTASVLGTCVHYVAEQYSKTRKITDADKAEIEAYIVQEAEKNPEVEADIVREQYKPMAEELVRNFLVSNMPTNSEDFMFEEILPGIGVGGSCDYYDEKTGTVGDYKTTGALNAPTYISKAYKWQLLVYAWLYRKQDLPVNRIKIIYVTRNTVGRVSEKTGKPMKDYPSTVTTITEEITDEDLDFIESIINQIAHSVQLWKTQPELHWALAQDFRLFKPTKPNPFKD